MSGANPYHESLFCECDGFFSYGRCHKCRKPLQCSTCGGDLSKHFRDGVDLGCMSVHPWRSYHKVEPEHVGAWWLVSRVGGAIIAGGVVAWCFKALWDFVDAVFRVR